MSKLALYRIVHIGCSSRFFHLQKQTQNDTNTSKQNIWKENHTTINSSHEKYFNSQSKQFVRGTIFSTQQRTIFSLILSRDVTKWPLRTSSPPLHPPPRSGLQYTWAMWALHGAHSHRGSGCYTSYYRHCPYFQEKKSCYTPAAINMVIPPPGGGGGGQVESNPHSPDSSEETGLHPVVQPR